MVWLWRAGGWHGAPLHLVGPSALILLFLARRPRPHFLPRGFSIVTPSALPPQSSPSPNTRPVRSFRCGCARRSRRRPTASRCFRFVSISVSPLASRKMGKRDCDADATTGCKNKCNIEIRVRHLEYSSPCRSTTASRGEKFLKSGNSLRHLGSISTLVTYNTSSAVIGIRIEYRLTVGTRKKN